MRAARTRVGVPLLVVVGVLAGPSSALGRLEVGPPPGLEAAQRAAAGERSSKGERERSRTEFDGVLSAQEARVLARQVAPALTAAAPLPDAEDVRRVLGPTALEVETDGRRRLLSSNLPVARREDGAWRLLDMDLVRRGGDIEARRQAGSVELPADAVDGVQLGGVVVVPGVEDSSAGSVAGDVVTYPNVATDTDLSVRSVPAGFATTHVLRSPQAPAELDFALGSLPAGARPVAVGEGPTRRAEVRGADGKALVGFSPALAWDADGESVPVRYVADGGRVRLEVEHRDRDVRYPVVVDPTVSQNWGSSMGSAFGAPIGYDYSGWTWEQNHPQFVNVRGNGGGFGWGNFVGSPDYAYFGSGYHFGQIAFRAIGDYSGDYTPQRTTITSFDSADFSIYEQHRYSLNPCLSQGFYEPTARMWDSQARRSTFNGFGFGPHSAGPSTHCGARGATWERHEVTPGADLSRRRSNAFLFHLSAWQPGYALAVTAALRWWSVQYVDQVIPAVGVGQRPDPGAWIDGSQTQSVSGVDRGSGVQALEVRSSPTGAPLGPAMTYPASTAAAQQLFPYAPEAKTFRYADAPEGEQTMHARAIDGAGLSSGDAPWTVKIDRSGPQLALSGDLYEQRGTPVPAGATRTLTVDARDGTPGASAAAQRSGVARVEVYVDGNLVTSEDQSVAGDSQPLAVQWETDSRFTAGEHSVRVVARDRLGHVSESTFSVRAECCGVPLDDGVVDVGARAHVFGDFDGDGQADVGLIDRATGGLAVAAGRGDGTFAPEAGWGSFGEPIDRVAAGNVDGDEESATAGTDDLVVRTASGALRVLLSDGSGFAAGQTAGMPDLQASWPSGRSLGLADVDGDTRLDVWGVDAASRRLSIGYSRGSAFDAETEWTTVPASRDVDMRDLDGDGLADLVTYDPADGSVRFHQSDGEALAASDVWGEASTGGDLALGDVDANGLDDAVLRSSAGSAEPGAVRAYRSSRNEGFVAGSADLGSLSDAYALNAVDLTGDGTADVVGTRVEDGRLLLRSAGSAVPDPDEPDPTPADPDPVEEGARTARAARGPVPIMMSDDAGLSRGDGIPGASDAERDQQKQLLLRQMGYLGAHRVRAVAYWGRMDRLNPADEQPGPTGQPAGLVLAAGQAAEAPRGRDGTPQSETNPPAPGTARRFRLARDVGAPPESLSGTVADRQPEWIAGEWRHVENRWYLGNHETLLRAAAAGEKTVHLTITGGGGGADFAECGRDDPRRQALKVRGCESRDAPTGRDPDPRRAAHAITEIAEHSRAVIGSRLDSVGVWNEPNLTGATFLARRGPRGLLDTSRLYGRIYAETYAELKGRGLLAEGGIRVGFGELSSGLSKYDEPSGSKLRSRTPAQWTASALDEAKDHPGVQWDAGRVRAHFIAIHPYQHTGRPWERNGRYPWGVHGVGKPTTRRKGSKVTSPSLKGFLSTRAAETFRRVGASSGTPPDIWATEFGYYNSRKLGERGVLNYKKESLALAYSEQERARLLTYRSSRSKGALPGLVEDGNVKVIGFWEVLEDPLVSIAPGAAADNDYGFIGTGTVQSDDSYRLRTNASGSWPNQAAYSGQFLRVAGLRVYGKAPTKRPPEGDTGAATYRRYDGLQWPQNRRTACAIRAWRGLNDPRVPGQPAC